MGVFFFSLVEFLYDFGLVFWDYKFRDCEKGRDEDEGSLGHGSGRLAYALAIMSFYMDQSG